MGISITKINEKGRSTAFTHKLADIPNGVNIAVADLGGDVIMEGSAVGVDASTGLFHIVKTAKIMASAGSDATTYTVAKGHHFIVGDIVMLSLKSKAYAITAIATNSTNSDYDDITVGTTLGASVSAGDVLIQANSAVASTSAFKYTPMGLVGCQVPKSVNTFVDVVTIGQIDSSRTDAAIGSVISGVLPTIVVL